MTFTDPEVASVGLSEAAAQARGIEVVVASADLQRPRAPTSMIFTLAR